MANAVMTWLLGIPLLGLATGMRAMTPIAICCWFAHLGLLPVHDTWAAWIASPISVGVFSVAALAEFVGDKLPQTPARIKPLGLISRLVFAGLVGSIIATSLQNSTLTGVLLAVIGALLGTFGGYLARRDLVRFKRCRDWPVALLEDFLAVLIAVFAIRLITA